MKVCRFLLCAVILSAALLLGGCGQSSVFTSYGGSGTGVSETSDEDAGEYEETSGIWVDVCGAVSNPGVYQLQEGSRLYEAVEMAGGFTEDADQDAVNLARIISDGEQIRIPSVSSGENTGQASAEDGRIDINTADQEELQQITGIGATRAAAIIAYRDANGPFTKTEEITLVDGIGDKTYEKLKDEIVVR